MVRIPFLCCQYRWEKGFPGNYQNNMGNRTCSESNWSHKISWTGNKTQADIIIYWTNKHMWHHLWPDLEGLKMLGNNLEYEPCVSRQDCKICPESYAITFIESMPTFDELVFYFSWVLNIDATT
jgi:hypothetical protein